MVAIAGAELIIERVWRRSKGEKPKMGVARFWRRIVADERPYDEMFEFAIVREIQAYQFYKAMAAQIDDLQTRAIFEDLAREELEHKAKLELEMMKEGRVTDIQPVDETEAEFEGGADMNYREVLLLGMQKEEVSFALYVELLIAVKDYERRKLLLALAEQELEHKRRFEAEYEKVTGQAREGEQGELGF